MRRSLSTLLLLLGAAAAAVADTPPEAKLWLEKIAVLPESGPYSFTMSAAVAGMPGAPAGTKASLSGTMTQNGRRHSMMEIQIDLSGGAQPPQGAPAPGPMTMKSISDGTTLWTEMLMMGNKQVMKMSLDQAEKIAREAGGTAPGAGMDPMAQVQAMTRNMDFEYLGQEGNLVKLKGTMKPNLKKSMPGMETMLMVIDSKTGFFHQISLGEGQIVIDFRDFKRLSSVDPALFTYTPPPGVAVMDLGPMIEAQMKAMQSQPSGN